MSFKYNISSTGTGGMMGRVQFITYPTNPENYPLPQGVSQLTNAANKQVYHRTVDRFWVVENNIENIAFSTYPEIEYVFQYSDFDITNNQNHINKDQLIVRAYNPGTQQWTDWFASPAFAQPVTNTISVILAGGNDYHGVWTLMDDSNPLPIELLSFSGSCNEGKTDILWTTASETNNNYFTIERSADANTFEVLKTIPGSSNSNYIISYSTVDEKPLSGTSYYRLKQTDYDGSYNYSNIISVNCGGSQDGFNVLYANADAAGNINMTVHAPDGGNYIINLIDATGKTVMSETSNFGKGSNTVSLEAQLASGIYFINISNEFTTVNRKVMVR
jgi:hypothetical protein